MSRIDRVKTKIQQIEKLMAEVKGEIEAIAKETQSQPKKVHAEELLPSEEQLREEYGRLYEEFMVRNFKAIEEFIKNKSKTYLKVFCRANNLPLDATKVSKVGIVDEVMKWMAQREVITKKAT